MFSPQPIFETAAPESTHAALARQLDAARNLALFGADALGRDLCASIFLNHGHVLAASRTLRQRFIECLMLLGMTNLLARLLRAADGVSVSVARTAGAGPARLMLSLSNGETLAIPVQEAGAGAGARSEHASLWSDRILDAAESPGVAVGFGPGLDVPVGERIGGNMARPRRALSREVVLPSLA